MWNPKLTCHDCAGPRYRDTIRCAYHGVRHQWLSKGIDLAPSIKGPMWTGKTPSLGSHKHRHVHHLHLGY